MIQYITGDILSAAEQAIVNPVNCEGVAGAGLAKDFKISYPDNFSKYKLDCSSKYLRPGKLSIFEYADWLNDTRYIINFPTKDKWKDPSKLSYISNGLEELISVVMNKQIRSIGIPKLGCGLGGLHWNDVRVLLDDFNDQLELLSKCDIMVYEFN